MARISDTGWGESAMKDQWRQRQAQWERFQAWENQHQSVLLSPPERLAEIGALVDRARQAASDQLRPTRATTATVEGIMIMRKRLALLGRKP